jgi:hypothetical protein
MDRVKKLEKRIHDIGVELSSSQMELSKKDLELQHTNHILSADAPGYIAHATNPIHMLAAKARAGRPLDALTGDSDDEGHDEGREDVVDDSTSERCHVEI